MCSVRQPRQLLPLLPRAILQLPVCQSCRFRCLSTPSSLPSPSVTTPRATRDLLSRSHSSSKTEPAQARHSSVLNKTHETPPIMASATSFYDFEPADKKGEPFPLHTLQGKLVLVVNTASKCGFTPQYKGLETLYQSIQAKYPGAFTVLGFPCNQFGSQDPGSNDDIQSFCQLNYGVSFPVLGKTNVNGEKAEPVWEWMKNEMPGLMGLKRVKWNFEKFLISADGKVIGRWASTTKPESLESVIVKEIQKAETNKTSGSAKEEDSTQSKLA